MNSKTLIWSGQIQEEGQYRYELCEEQQGECRSDLLWQRWHGQFSWIALWRPVHRSRCLSPPHWSGPSPPLDTAADRQGGIKGSFERRFNKLTECCLPRRLCKWGAASSVFLGHSLTMFRCSIKLLPNCTQLCYNWIIGDWDAFS